nr:immunoglobulin light chain junction region [Macaca mulatta]MOW14962.1 immunoglobulin light chain junction region [Macaca mulatta]MOW15568.1 immunoglobulin light chain junction region [Macaca mulatta]MOW18339.1 immunoglobulin light chain junction region [Macaca mulatta]MOW31746.1 immunoglobulin light chain junction region [Macaca mulatta]
DYYCYSTDTSGNHGLF